MSGGRPVRPVAIVPTPGAPEQCLHHAKLRWHPSPGAQTPRRGTHREHNN